MKTLGIVLLFLVTLPAVAGPKLYVFDCGTVRFESLAMFNLTPEESSVRELFVPCYLIRHKDGILLWDAGLPKSVADAGEPVPFAGGSMTYERWIVDQLADMDITPADITHAAYSHLHFDHAGAANAMVANTVLMQQAEWDAAFDGSQEFIDPSLIEGLKQAKITFLNGDHDVFGDGSVRLVYAPGHTPGHQVLLVTLDNMGPVLISGDLYHTRANRALRRAPTFNYDAEQTFVSMDAVEQLLIDSGATLWIEHDKALADTLRKAPAYYD
jgi:glyoxylase-like metal-dependent hydrolase (beta-lactamase superfamily II)